MASEGENEAEADEDWRFAVEDVGPDGQRSEGGSNGENADDPIERPPLEPGSPSLENTLFVLLGVGLTLFVIVQVVVLTLG